MLAKLAVAAVVSAVTVGAAEWALRFVWERRGEPFSPAHARHRMTSVAVFLREGVVGELRAQAGGEARADAAAPTGGSSARRDRVGHGRRRTVESETGYTFRSYLHPYFGWDIDSPWRTYDQQRAVFHASEGDEYVDIFLLGGSVAAGFPACGKPALFDVLQSDPRFAGRELRLWNHASAAYKQPQQLMRLAYLMTLGCVPDIVINLDGFNEVAVATENANVALHPLHPTMLKGCRWLEPQATFDVVAELRTTQLEARDQLERALEYGCDRSVLSTELALIGLNRARERGLEQYDKLVELSRPTANRKGHRGPPFPQGRAMMELMVEGWANASLAMQGMCQARGTFYLHVLQPTLHDRGAKPMTAEEERSGQCTNAWLGAVRLGYPMLRAAGRKLSERGVAFLDASGVFAQHEGTLYFDPCHFLCEGHQILARAIGAELLAQGPSEIGRSRDAGD